MIFLMATSTRTDTQCDLCGITSSSVGDRNFDRRGGFDFCRWCMSKPFAKTECGTHAVTMSDGSWSCDCGVVMKTVKDTLWRHGVSSAVMASVPSIEAATAVIHVQTPNWPQTW